jgi:hypothetical protein
MSMKVVAAYNSNFRQAAETLRVIAREIEDGTYGEVSCCGLVLLGSTMEVFTMGPDSDAPSASLLFNAAILRMAQAIEKKGK